MKVKIELGPFATQQLAEIELNKLMQNYHPAAYDTYAKVQQIGSEYFVVGFRNNSAD